MLRVQPSLASPPAQWDVEVSLPPELQMQNILDQNLDMATALLAGEKLKELILPGSSQDEKGGALASLMVQLKLELPFDRVVTIGTVIIPILLVTLVFTRNFAGELSDTRKGLKVKTAPVLTRFGL